MSLCLDGRVWFGVVMFNWMVCMRCVMVFLRELLVCIGW